jgi:hypothetical protein
MQARAGFCSCWVLIGEEDAAAEQAGTGAPVRLPLEQLF